MYRSRFAAPIALALAIGWAAPALTQPASPPPADAPAMPAPSGPAVPLPLQPGDAFGQEVMLPERTIVYLKGHTTWDAAFETLADAFKSLREYFDKQGIKPNGPALIVYTETNDRGFQFQAALPAAEAPKEPPKGDLAVGPAPSGKALKFVHRGSYDAMDSTYEAITNHLDEKRLEAQDMFIEEYATDPSVANPDNLVVNVFVPIK